MFPSPCSIIDSDSDSRVLSSSVAPVAPVKLVLPPILSTTPPAETVKVPPTPPKIKKVRRRKCTLRILLPDGVTSLDNLASTSTPPEWAAHFKKADFGTDYTLRPRIERPRYDFPSDEAVDAAITAASCPSRRKSKVKFHKLEYFRISSDMKWRTRVWNSSASVRHFVRVKYCMAVGVSNQAKNCHVRRAEAREWSFNFSMSKTHMTSQVNWELCITSLPVRV